MNVPKGFTIFSETPHKHARVIKAINEEGNKVYKLFKLNDSHKFVNNGVSAFSTYSTPGKKGISDLTMYDSYGRVLAADNEGIKNILQMINKYGIKVEGKVVK